MAKWTKETFEDAIKNNCIPHTCNVIVDLIKFSEEHSDVATWGRGEGYGTLTFKCRSDDYGIVPLFLITTQGHIKFQLNFLRNKVRKKEIIRDYQLKLESNFMYDFSEDTYQSDIFHDIDVMFNMQADVEKFKHTILGISDRLRQ